MKTPALISIIGEPISEGIIKDRYGNAHFHANQFVSCDPCYLPEPLATKIRDAYRSKYPWEGYDYPMHHAQWCEFEMDGQTCYARDHEDGVGYFGNCIDAGWVVVIPAALCPTEVITAITTANSTLSAPQ